MAQEPPQQQLPTFFKGVALKQPCYPDYICVKKEYLLNTKTQEQYPTDAAYNCLVLTPEEERAVATSRLQPPPFPVLDPDHTALCADLNLHYDNDTIYGGYIGSYQLNIPLSQCELCPKTQKLVCPYVFE